ncbi:hypothetical protein BP6252_05026 [Coleophoma cylindrospora]|uniref:Uncharacterized protein n=1 Tax=Coleophoma cylindrospora TaxID=1849047 RepID=A0A3D8RSE0_9HELO|nr:hypothetical protein BP6252_05026 [Coleophoma cylindrospora]
MGYFSNSDEITTTNWDFVKKSDNCVPSDNGSELSDSESNPNLQLPKPVSDFFSGVATKGYPHNEPGLQKAQPWLKVWDGIIEPDRNGDLLVACPKKCDWGSNLGGY